MAVPTAVATNIRYNNVDYAFGTPIVFTELKPTIEVTFDLSDYTQLRIYNTAGTTWQSDYFFEDTRGRGVVVSSTVIRQRLDLHSTTDTIGVYGYNTEGQGTLKTWAVSVSLTTGATDSWQTLGATILRDTLIADLPSADLTTITEGGLYKIAWEGASEEWAQPYIITQIITGGDRNSSQVAYAEMLWRVVVHTPSISTASAMQNAIHKALARATATVNYSDVTQAGEIEEVTPVTDRYQVENVPLYVSGGIYRIRLAKG